MPVIILKMRSSPAIQVMIHIIHAEIGSTYDMPRYASITTTDVRSAAKALNNIALDPALNKRQPATAVIPLTYIP